MGNTDTVIQNNSVDVVSLEGGMEGARRATGDPPSKDMGVKSDTLRPDPEVPEKKPRRKYTAQYKLRILDEADAFTAPGQIGALLRSEGLYSSNLTSWRKQREKGLLQALSPKKRGRKGKKKNPLAQKVAQLEREIEHLRRKLKQAETIIVVQKKISEILGISQNLPEDEGSNL